MSADLKAAYRSLDPLAPLEPGSPFYVERPDNPLDRVAVDLKLSDRPRHYLLAGHRGTGKSTELGRLGQALARECEVLYADIGSRGYLSGADPTQVLGAAIESLVDWPGSSSPSLDELLEYLDKLFSKGRPIVVILDGLERMESDHAVLAALKRPIPIDSWPVSVVCTIPLSLYLSDALGEHARRFDRSVFLPGIAISDQTGRTLPQGFETLSTIIHRRVGEGSFDAVAAAALAPYSAGIHRELLQLAQRACVVAAAEGAERVSLAHAEAAIGEQRNEYSVVLRKDDYPILRELGQTKQLRGGADVARLIRNQLIVAYANGTTWFDVHPILGSLVERGDGS